MTTSYSSFASKRVPVSSSSSSCTINNIIPVRIIHGTARFAKISTKIVKIVIFNHDDAMARDYRSPTRDRNSFVFVKNVSSRDAFMVFFFFFYFFHFTNQK